MNSFVTRGDIAQHFRVTTRAVDNWRSAGLLPEPLKLGTATQSRVRWPADVIPKLEAAFSAETRAP